MNIIIIILNMNKIITRNDTVYGIIPIPNYALDVIHTPKKFKDT